MSLRRHYQKIVFSACIASFAMIVFRLGPAQSAEKRSVALKDMKISDNFAQKIPYAGEKIKTSPKKVKYDPYGEEVQRFLASDMGDSYTIDDYGIVYQNVADPQTKHSKHRMVLEDEFNQLVAAHENEFHEVTSAAH